MFSKTQMIQNLSDWFSSFFRRWKRILFNPHNRIKLPLSRFQWCDVDHRIELALDELVKSFVEDENPWEVINWDSDDEHKAAKLAITHAYDFICNIRPSRKRKIDELTDLALGKDWLNWFKKGDESKWKEIFILEEKLFLEENEVYESIVKYRGYMWT